VASDVIDQEALAMLVLTAGWGNPAADLPEDIHTGESVSFTEDGSAVPVADLHGRLVDEEREPPLVSTATGDYLLRKLSELASGRDADPGRTPDQQRRLLLRRLLPELNGEELARRLTGVLGRMSVDMPTHSSGPAGTGTGTQRSLLPRPRTRGNNHPGTGATPDPERAGTNMAVSGRTGADHARPTTSGSLRRRSAGRARHPAVVPAGGGAPGSPKMAWCSRGPRPARGSVGCDRRGHR